MRTRTRGDESGFALIMMLILVSLLMGLLISYFGLTWIEMSTTRATMASFVGFYAAEAGLNLRAETVRNTFQGYTLPTGSSPDTSGSNVACSTGNTGSGDFRCIGYSFQDRGVATYVAEAANSDTPMVVPRGETYQNLNGREFHYVVYSTATSKAKRPEAVLELHFRSRTVPMFQFAAFYDKDLEILGSTNAMLSGPVHGNRDVYVGSAATLDIVGQLTTAGTLFRGRKDADTCLAGPVRVYDPDDPVEIPACSTGRRAIAQSVVTSWGGMIDVEAPALTVPLPQAIDPGEDYWDAADARIVLDLNGGPAIEIREAAGGVDGSGTAALIACGAASHGTSLYDNREGTAITMLDLDVGALLDCIDHVGAFGLTLDDTTGGGLIFHLTVAGADSATINDYGVRLRNAATLAGTDVSAPPILGLTIVTDQALYVEGDYNAVNKIPAALLADSINVLSNNWLDANSALPLTHRIAGATTVNAAFLAGTDSTGGAEGVAGRDAGAYNGGLTGFIRLHEDWSAATFVYRGSFVSLSTSRHVDGPWGYGDPYYTSPIRDWDYDTDFEDAVLLPPMSPEFVYLTQELFVRQFEL